jgi:hypothetical protein
LFWGLMLWIPISCPNLIVVTLCVGADAEIDPSESGIATTARCFQILLSPQVTSNRLQRECVIWLHFVRTPCVPVRNVARLRAVHLIFREFRVNWIRLFWCLFSKYATDFLKKHWFSFYYYWQDDDFDESAYVPGKTKIVDMHIYDCDYQSTLNVLEHHAYTGLLSGFNLQFNWPWFLRTLRSTLMNLRYWM